MSFNGYLIKLGGVGGTELPLRFMRYETYKVTRSTMDLDPTRDTTGLLHRHTLSHTASKVEFNIPRMTNWQVNEFMQLLHNAMGSRQLEKTLTMEYYEPESDSYKTGTFYVPDITFTISNIDTATNKINYAETRVAFIEY